MSNELKQLSIGKTKGEWDLIKEKLNEKKLNTYVKAEVRKLVAAYNNCPQCISKAKGNKEYRRPKITMDNYEKLKKLSADMKVPVSSIVDMFIIQPLLTPKY